jgi:hypothetical protein
METVDKVSAITIIVGSVLFLVAAFSPISRIFGMPDAGGRLEIIAGSPNQWLLAQLLFALGSIVTAVGIGLVAVRFAGQGFTIYLTTSAVVMVVGALLWCWHVYLRAVEPARFVAGEIPLWLFAAYSLLTMAGLALLGTALLQTTLAAWVGWLPIGSAALFLVLALVFGDMPPFVYYVITLTIGVVLYRAAASGVNAVVTIG